MNQTHPEMMKSEMVKSEIRYAGFWIRLAADFIDSTLLDLIAAAFSFVILGAVYWIQVLFGIHPSSEGSFFESFNSILLQVVFLCFRLALSLIYYGIGTYRYGTTLGKRVFRIRVVNAKDFGPISLKQSMIRCCCYVLSYLPMGAGFLMIAFNSQKQGLHDGIAGTFAIRKSPSSSSL